MTDSAAERPVVDKSLDECPKPYKVIDYRKVIVDLLEEVLQDIKDSINGCRYRDVVTDSRQQGYFSGVMGCAYIAGIISLKEYEDYKIKLLVLTQENKAVE